MEEAKTLYRTTRDLAREYGVCETTVRRWLHDEERRREHFPGATKIGKDWRVPVPNIDRKTA